MEGEIPGVSAKEEIVENKQGGKQSKVLYALHLIDPKALLSLGSIMEYGATKYNRDNWRKIECESHLNHLMIHILAYLSGDRQDLHLEHAFCRAMMALATAPEGIQAQIADQNEPSGFKAVKIK